MAKYLDEYGVYSLGPVVERKGISYTWINDVLFCVKKSDIKLDKQIADIVSTSKDLDEVYEDPTPAKINKYNLWECWASQIRNLYSFGIIECSNKDFTLGGYLELDYDKQGVILIKPGRYVPDACMLILEG